MADHQNDSIPEQYPHHQDLVNRVAKKLEVAAKSPERNILHIIARGVHWIIKREGALKAYRIYDTKELAIKNAKAMLELGSASRIIIHEDDGTVAQRI